MDDLTVFKRRVGYKVKADQDTQTASGNDRVYTLRFENVFDVVILFNGEEVTSGYEVDSEAGTITFTTAPTADTVIVVNYKFAPFTDDEANALISEYGLDGAVIEALRELLANSARLMNYKQGDTEVDYSTVFKQVKELLKMYMDEAQAQGSEETPTLTVGTRKDPRISDESCQEPDLSRLYG
jgi:hypothetical protein